MGQDFHTPIFFRDLHGNHGAVVADYVGLCSGKDALEEVEGHRPFANPQTSGFFGWFFTTGFRSIPGCVSQLESQ